MIRASSVPNRPPSPACGLRPQTAMRGVAMPKSVCNAAATIRARRSISGCDSRPDTSDSAQCTVSGTARRLGPASIITACSASIPQTSARNSVCPGCSKPTADNCALATGAVTTPAALPSSTQRVASASECSASAAPCSSGRPTVAVTSSWPRTGNARPNTSRACAGSSIGSTANARPRPVAAAASTFAPPTTKKGARPSSKRRAQLSTMISGPIPAGSPIDTARGAMLSVNCTR